MKRAIFAMGALAMFLLRVGGSAHADNPLFLPKAEKSLPLMSGAEAGDLKKEAEAMKRKADLLKEAATKKYAAAGDLRKKAGGFRSESAKKGEALRSKAEESAAVTSLIGDMFSIVSSMGGMGGGVSTNTALASTLTSKMIQGQQTSDAKSVMTAQAGSQNMAMEAEKKAGPLEMRADELENEGNRLMEACNRLMGIANAKFLLVAADELAKKVDADRRYLEQLKESNRVLFASMYAR